MAKKQAEDKKLSWSDIDMPSLKGEVLKLHGAYIAASQTAREAREKFEESFLAEARKKKLVPEGKTLRFSYRFGKIGVAQDDDTGETKKKAEAFKL